MCVVTVAAVVGAVAAVGGTAYSIVEGQAAASARSRQAQAEQQMQQLKAMREKTDAIRASRIAAANAISSGENQGAGMSSGVQGGAGSIISQGGANLSFLDQTSFLADQASIEAGKAAQAGYNSSVGSAVAGAGSSIFRNSDSISKGIKSVF